MLPITDPYSLSKLFQTMWICHSDHVSHYLKFKIILYQQGFFKPKSATIISVTYVDFISLSDNFQRQTDDIYFDLGNAFDLIPYSQLLHQLTGLDFLMAM
jgi:hypothetical protein